MKVKPTKDDVIERFQTVESDLGLYQWDIDGVYSWNRIREDVLRHCLDSYSYESWDEVVESNYREYVGALWKMGKNVVHGNPYLGCEAEIVLWGQDRRQRGPDGLWWDIHCDPIIDALNRECLYLEFTHDNDYPGEPKTDSIKRLDSIIYLAEAVRILGISSVTLPSDDLEFIQETEDHFSECFGIDIDLERRIKEDLRMRTVQLPLFRTLLQKIDPELALLVSINKVRKTFIEACKSLSIPVVELQHGIIDGYHLRYSYPWNQTPETVTPDYFFAYGEFVNDISEFKLKDRIHVVGYPYLELQAETYWGNNPKDQILFISQDTVGKTLSKLAEKLDDHTAFDHEIVYKLHPKEYDDWQVRYPELADSSITVIAEETSLYQLFSESDFQIGVNSTALYEGLYFGVKTLLYDHSAVPVSRYLKEQPGIWRVASVQNVVDIVVREASTPDFDSEYFFAHDSLSKAENKINNIIR